ncbi:hypothetical protein D3C81_1427080 [compost metagenome]
MRVVGPAFQVMHQLPRHQQGQRIERMLHGATRRAALGAGEAGRQHHDARGTQPHGRGDRRVVGHAAIDQRPAFHVHRRKHARNGRAGQHRIDDIARGQHHFVAGMHVGGHDIEWQAGMFKPRFAEVA